MMIYNQLNSQDLDSASISLFGQNFLLEKLKMKP